MLFEDVDPDRFEDEPTMNNMKGRSPMKLVVKNIAFEATVEDLRQLLHPFGQIKRLRLPKNFGGDHRGFAFVEYVTKQEVEKAF
ncbi:Splicing factor-like protein [Parasponia andersonii]|uniref:Splicing factor-like protein n=1 Tax=Parasponia andersonii TaxID=3476 RepID=A0A2P5ATV4_PARAD|nr:Splicing factor-like protein [Parasponia andersonii]